MSAAADVARLHRKFDKLERQFDGRELEAQLLKVGKLATPFVNEAVRATPAAKGSLSDGVMSGPGRWSTFSLKGEAKALEGSRPTVVIRPTGKSRGPMRVLEDGRKGYSAGDRRKSGTRLNKDKVRVDKFRKIKRNLGATEGKQTWTRATTVMARYVPAAGRREFVNSWKKALS